MYRGKTVAVVIPAYNEEGLVGAVIDSIPAYVDRVYVVDDCSTDSTWKEINDRVEGVDEQRLTAKTDGGRLTSRVVPIRHETNQGVGAAIKTGYQRALTDGMDVTAVINGDGQMDPDILDRFIEPIVEGNAEYTKGNRLRSSELRSEMSTWRFTGNAILTFLTKISSGYWKMTDPQNGYTAISLEALEAIDLDSLYDRYGFLNDLLVSLNAHGYRVADIPMKAVYGDEESGIRYSSFVPGLSLLLFQDFLWRLKYKYFVTDFHPLVLFYVLGTLGTLLGVGYGIWGVVVDSSLIAGGLALLIVLFSTTLVLFAMVFDMQHNEHLEYKVSF
ncbi:glycosyltransferase family 2 protein [Halorientalis brevis]|uniref:Glycosyltransferase family 2 protein n=1 Tax=Halorientalis brevis TaxID=1126241 RepID=A0ABD6CG74_9EURY|nr:glycosyltransferase family 2 protein [Halorientalis brevis]